MGENMLLTLMCVQIDQRWFGISDDIFNDEALRDIENMDTGQSLLHSFAFSLNGYLGFRKEH